jgi:hypothetical protein
MTRGRPGRRPRAAFRVWLFEHPLSKLERVTCQVTGHSRFGKLMQLFAREIADRICAGKVGVIGKPLLLRTLYVFTLLRGKRSAAYRLVHKVHVRGALGALFWRKL